MVRGNPSLLCAWSARPVLAAACLLVILASGCGQSVSPEQKQAITDLQRLGARVNYRGGGYEVDLKDTAAEDRHLEHLTKIANLKAIDLRGTSITDAGLEHLREIKTLEFVDFSRTRITDEGVQSLQKSLPEAQLVR